MQKDDDEILIPRIDMTKPVGSSEEMQRLRAAYDRVKEFPEASPDGWARMLDLRQAAEKVLERYG